MHTHNPPSSSILAKQIAAQSLAALKSHRKPNRRSFGIVGSELGLTGIAIIGYLQGTISTELLLSIGLATSVAGMGIAQIINVKTSTKQRKERVTHQEQLRETLDHMKSRPQDTTLDAKTTKETNRNFVNSLKHLAKVEDYDTAAKVWGAYRQSFPEQHPQKLLSKLKPRHIEKIRDAYDEVHRLQEGPER